MDNPCVILAGGLGTRLSSVLHDMPKCLEPISNSTSLKYQMPHLHKSAFTSFGEKKDSSAGLINTGIYRVNQKAIRIILSDKLSFELEILPRLINMRQLCSRVLDGSFIDLSITDDYKKLSENKELYFE